MFYLSLCFLCTVRFCSTGRGPSETPAISNPATPCNSPEHLNPHLQRRLNFESHVFNFLFAPVLRPGLSDAGQIPANGHHDCPVRCLCCYLPVPLQSHPQFQLPHQPSATWQSMSPSCSLITLLTNTLCIQYMGEQSNEEARELSIS